MRDDVRPVLTRFLADLRDQLDLTALWAHGSLALGDYQHGRSDLDMIAVVGADVDDAQRARLQTLHERLAADHPEAAKLHCSYIPAARIADPATQHLTWAHEMLMTRTVTPVSRRELHLGDLTFAGPPPVDLLPPVGDDELAAFIRADLRDFWLPATARPMRWLKDIWVDLGMLTAARATVTLDDGRLITKSEALDVLTRLGAPPHLVAGIRARRYATPAPPPLPFPRRLPRAHLSRTFTRQTLTHTLTR